MQIVFIEGSRGPEPQLWHVKQTDGNGKAKSVLAGPFEVPEELRNKSLAEIAEAFKDRLPNAST